MQPDSLTYKILVIDDDNSFSKLLEKIITDEGYLFKRATSGQEGLDTAHAWQPSLVLLDLGLSDMDGMDVLQKLRSELAFENTPIVIVSAYSDEKRYKECLSSGATDFIEKPINPVKFIIKIKIILENFLYRNKVNELNAKLSRERKLLGKYFSLDFVEQVLNEEISVNLGGENLDAAILFFDIRKSTNIAEQLAPDQFAEFLNQLFTDIMDLIYGCKGSVNKMLGDGILATFGCPVPSDADIHNCVRCALEIREYMNTFNSFRPKYLKNPVKAGMGIAAGSVFAGNVGSVRRMEYTVLGDPVNLASRLESLTKFFEVDIIIAGTIRDALGEKIKIEKIDVANIRGKIKEIDMYHLKGWSV